MSGPRCWCVTGLLLACAFVTSAGQANAPYARQYYGGWSYHQQRNYYYRPYYYKPAPTYVGYKHHYVIYQPARPKHYYYFNPYRKAYWGRCPTETNGVGQYSHLAEKDQRANLDEIAESAFPPMGAMPAVPESQASENLRMDLPPDDLPAVAGLPADKTRP